MMSHFEYNAQLRFICPRSKVQDSSGCIHSCLKKLPLRKPARRITSDGGNHLTRRQSMLCKVLNISIRVLCQVQEAGLDGVLCDGRIHKGDQALQHLGNCEFEVGDLQSRSSWLTAGASAATADRMVMRCR